VQLLRVPYSLLFPAIILFCLVGVYSVNYNVLEVFVMAFFGVVGFLMKKFGFEPAPFVMGLVLSPIMENGFRQSLVLGDGRFSIFFTRTISASLIIAGLCILVVQAVLWLRKKE